MSTPPVSSPEPPLRTSAHRVRPPRLPARVSALEAVTAAVVPVVLLALLIAFAVNPPGGTAGSDAPGRGLDGVGDPYFPGAGGAGYDAALYRINLAWDGRVLAGDTTMEATATQELAEIHLDLQLPATSATVNGEPAELRLRGADDLIVTPGRVLPAGEPFTVGVAYGGDPGLARKPDVEPGWVRTGDTVTAVGEPFTSSWWFPANDHPRDPAQLDVRVRVPAGVEALSVGRLIGRDIADDPATDTWHWSTTRPIVSYATFLSIGEYRIESGTATGAMTRPRPYLYAVSEQLSREEQDRALAQLRRTPELVGELEAIYGDFPVEDIGGVVPPHQLWFAGMETQGRPVYARDAITDAGEAPRLIVHEMAHMWFGDTITLNSWRDLFLNEAYASHAEWQVARERGGEDPNDRLRHGASTPEPGLWRQRMDDPGADTLFDGVYTRGPMAMQALSNVMGVEAFDAFNRQWAAGSGPHSLEEWYAMAKTHTDTDLQPWYDAWISGTAPPPQTARTGWPQ